VQSSKRKTIHRLHADCHRISGHIPIMDVTKGLRRQNAKGYDHFDTQDSRAILKLVLMNGDTRVRAGFIWLRTLSCSALLSTCGCRKFLDLIMKNIAPSSYLLSSQSANPCPEVEITIKICHALIFMHFTSSAKRYFNRWPNCTKQSNYDKISV
jgi:hypothetical protein